MHGFCFAVQVVDPDTGFTTRKQRGILLIKQLLFCYLAINTLNKRIDLWSITCAVVVFCFTLEFTSCVEVYNLSFLESFCLPANWIVNFSIDHYVRLSFSGLLFSSASFCLPFCLCVFVCVIDSADITSYEFVCLPFSIIYIFTPPAYSFLNSPAAYMNTFQLNRWS